MLSVVVGGRGDSHKAVGEALNTSWYDRVGSDHHGHAVSLEESIQVVSSEQDDVVLLLRVSYEVMLETVLLLSLVRIRPHEVNESLVVLAVVSS